MPSRPDKLTKRGSTSRCTICRKEGHNRATCPDVCILTLDAHFFVINSTNLYVHCTVILALSYFFQRPNPTIPRPSKNKSTATDASTQESQAPTRPHGGKHFISQRMTQGLELGLIWTQVLLLLMYVF